MAMLNNQRVFSYAKLPNNYRMLEHNNDKR